MSNTAINSHSNDRSPIHSKRMPSTKQAYSPGQLSKQINEIIEKLDFYISNSSHSCGDELKGIHSEIAQLLALDDAYRISSGRKPESKVSLLAPYSKNNKLALIEQQWIDAFNAVAIASLTDETPTLKKLRRLDAVIRKFNQVFSSSGWNFSLSLFQQLSLNRFEVGESLRALLRLSGRGTELPGVYGYRMAATNLFNLGMHVKSSLPNELEYDLRPLKSLRLAIEVITQPNNSRFQNNVSLRQQATITTNLTVGTIMFLVGSCAFWQAPPAEPLRCFLRENKNSFISLLTEARNNAGELATMFIHSSSPWLHSDVFQSRKLPIRPRASWDELILDPFRNENIYWYRILFRSSVYDILSAWHEEKNPKFIDRNHAIFDKVLNALASLG